jgi:plasmid stabilization system protein ParE
MVKLIWSPRAASDLEDICNFIASDSEHNAKTFAQRIVEMIESIPDFPKAGRIVPEYQLDEIRERLYQDYRIIYRIKKDSVEIVTIIHGARLLPEIE